MSDYDDLMPTPLEVELAVAAVKRPLVAAAILGLPFGLASVGIALLGIHPHELLVVGSGPELSFPLSVHFLGGWLSGAFTMLIYLSRPY